MEVIIWIVGIAVLGKLCDLWVKKRINELSKPPKEYIIKVIPPPIMEIHHKEYGKVETLILN